MMRTRHLLLSLCLLISVSIRESSGQFPSICNIEQELAFYPTFVRLSECSPQPGDDPLVLLLKKRHNAALGALRAYHSEFLAGRGTVEFMYDMARNFRNSRQELSLTQADGIKLQQHYLDWTNFIEEIQKRRRDAAKVPEKMYQESIAQRLRAEMELLELKSKSAKR
jgi:hypothetical protein